MQKLLVDAKYKLKKLKDAIQILDVVISKNREDWTLYLKRAMYRILQHGSIKKHP